MNLEREFLQSYFILFQLTKGKTEPIFLIWNYPTNSQQLYHKIQTTGKRIHPVHSINSVPDDTVKSQSRKHLPFWIHNVINMW